MAVTVRIHVEDVNTQMDTYESIKLYRGTTAAGTTTSSTLVSTTTLVEDQEDYSVTDSSGTAESWYGYTLYHSTGPVQSAISRRFRTTETSLHSLRIEAARRANAGYSSTCSGNGTTTTLVDAALQDSGVDTNFMQGAYLFRPDAAAAGDYLRRIASYSAGTFTVDREYTNATESAEIYQVFSLAPPIDHPSLSYSWLRAVNDGLRECRWIDALNLGDGQTYGKTDFSLAPHLGYINPHRDIRKLFVRHYVDETNSVYEDTDWNMNGRFWTRIQNAGDFHVRLYPSPLTSETVWIEVRRSGESLFHDDDVTNCPLEQAAYAGAWKMLQHLVDNGKGEYTAQAALMAQRFEQERKRVTAPGLVIV